MRTRALTCKPGDNRPQIQAAVDALLAQGGGELLLDAGGGPGQPWPVSRPVLLDGDNLSVRGWGKKQTRVAATGTFFPWLGGYKYARELPAHHWEDASPHLDGSCGQRYALRTHSDANVSFVASPFDGGPQGGWESVRRLTLDAAFVCHQKAGDGSVPLFGMVDSHRGLAAPFYLQCGNGNSNFVLSTAEHRQLVIRLPHWSPAVGQPVRLSIDLDLDAGACRVWVDGQAATVTTDGVSLAGQTFVAKSDNCPAKLGALSFDHYNWGAAIWSHDTTYFGFKITLGAVYVDVDAQARLDGQPITDQGRYFSVGSDTLFLLPLTENAPPDRLVRWQSGVPVPGHGGLYGFGQFLLAANGNSQDLTYELRLADLWSSGTGPYGAGFALGASHDLRVDDCVFEGGAYGWLGMSTFVGYPHRFNGVEFQRGRVAGFASHRSTVDMRTCTHLSYARHAMVLIGCNAGVHQALFGTVPSCESAVRIFDGQSGGMYQFDQGTMFNFEWAAPTRAYIEIDGHSHGAVPSTTLLLQNVAMGGLTPGTAYVRCNTPVEPPPGEKRFSVIFDHVSRYANPAAMVTGPGWEIEHKGFSPVVKDGDGLVVPLVVGKGAGRVEA